MKVHVKIPSGGDLRAKFPPKNRDLKALQNALNHLRGRTFFSMCNIGMYSTN